MSLLTDLQQEAAARLAAQAFFLRRGKCVAASGRTVLTEQIGSLPARVAQSLGQLGVVCVLLTPTARTTHPNYPRPYFDEIQLVARTQENVLLNHSATGTGQSASLVAESVAWFLHGFAPAGLGCTLRLDGNPAGRRSPAARVRNGFCVAGRAGCAAGARRSADELTQHLNPMSTPSSSIIAGPARITLSRPDVFFAGRRDRLDARARLRGRRRRAPGATARGPGGHRIVVHARRRVGADVRAAANARGPGRRAGFVRRGGRIGNHRLHRRLHLRLRERRADHAAPSGVLARGARSSGPASITDARQRSASRPRHPAGRVVITPST